MFNSNKQITEPLKIFIASSLELKPERDRTEILIRRLNRTWLLENKPQIDLELWETFSEVMPPVRTQSIYNENIKDCDLFILVLWTKVGKFTQEEFRVAERLFRHLERPRILILQKTSSYIEPALEQFLNQFKQEGSEYFFRQFSDLPEFELILTAEINHIYRWKYAINFNPALDFRKALLPGLMNRYKNRINGRMEEEIAFKLDLQLRYTVDESAKDFLSHSGCGNIISVKISTLTDLVILFTHNVKRLMITGDPGSGKTVMLLELAKELTQRAIFNHYFPIPVLLNLDTWRNEYSSFDRWLEINLASAAGEYGISKELAKKVVEENNLILLLDGFDEIAEGQRDSFLIAIRKYLIRLENTQPKRRYPQLILTSRRIEYIEVTEEAYVRGVMDILPLKLEQIREYLDTKTDDNYSAELLLEKFEQDNLLPHRINTAFLIHLSLNMVHDFDFTKFDEWKLIGQYAHKELAEQSFATVQKSRGYLKYLAIKLYNQKKGMRFELADLQPGWLGRPFLFRIFYCIYCMLIGAIGALLIALTILLVVEEAKRSEGKGNFTTKMLLIGSYLGGSYWVSTLLSRNIILQGEIHSFSFKYWSLRSFRVPFLGGYKKGMILGTLLPIGFIFVQIQKADFMEYFYFVIGCIVVGQIAGLCSGIIDGFVSGFFKTQPMPKKIKHYAVLKASLIFDLTKGFVKFYAVYFLTYIMILSYNADYSFGNDFSTLKQILFAIFAAAVISISSTLVEFMISSPLVKHFILRFLLFLQGHIPFRLAKFLTAMSETGLMEKDGSKWRFRHLLFQEYFATEDSPRKAVAEE